MISLCFFLFSFSFLPPFLFLYASDDKLSVFVDFLIWSKFHYLTCSLNQPHWVLSLVILLKFMLASTAMKMVYRNCPLTSLLSYTKFLQDCGCSPGTGSRNVSKVYSYFSASFYCYISTPFTSLNCFSSQSQEVPSPGMANHVEVALCGQIHHCPRVKKLYNFALFL